MPATSVSIVIPALNEGARIRGTLAKLQAARENGHELILVDGGSSDETVSMARPLVDQLIISRPGRAIQMNAGAKASCGKILWFLHADTLVPDNALEALQSVVRAGHRWGRFNVRLSGPDWQLRIIERMMNLRSCITGIATGDQGIFVLADMFWQLDAYPDIPLMEDIALSRRLRKIGRPACVREVLVTSSRRWVQNGILRTVMLMWTLRFLYWLGVSPNKLVRWYYG